MRPSSSRRRIVRSERTTRGVYGGHMLALPLDGRLRSERTLPRPPAPAPAPDSDQADGRDRRPPRSRGRDRAPREGGGQRPPPGSPPEAGGVPVVRVAS